MRIFCCLRPKRTINTSNLTREQQLKIIADRAEIPIQLISQDLAETSPANRTNKADKLMQELQAIKNFFKNALDKSVVDNVIDNIKTYTSPEYQYNLDNDIDIPVIHVREIKLLKEYYEPNVAITDMFTFEAEGKREEPKSPGIKRAIH